MEIKEAFESEPGEIPFQVSRRDDLEFHEPAFQVAMEFIDGAQIVDTVAVKSGRNLVKPGTVMVSGLDVGSFGIGSDDTCAFYPVI